MPAHDLFDELPVSDHEPVVPALMTQGNKKLGESVLVFNLPVFATCPGKSPACESVCYADKGNWRWPQNRKRNERNLAATQEPRFVRRAVAELQRRGTRLVRIHSAGDFYDAVYVRKWREIATALPDHQFWAYTRSWRIPAILESLKLLAQAPNVRLWFSADRDTGLPPAVQNVRVAWLQMEGEPPQEAASGTTPATLVFPVKKKGRQPMKRVGLALVCPTYNGTPEGAAVTCETCGVCWK